MPFILLKLVADVALVVYVFLLVQDKHAPRASRESSIRQLRGTARRAPYVRDPTASCRNRARRRAHDSFLSDRPQRADPWTTRARSPLPANSARNARVQARSRGRSRCSRRVRAIRSCRDGDPCRAPGEFREARELIAEAAAYLAEADTALVGHPDVRYAGFLHDAKKEFAEANLTLAFVAGKPMPDRRRARGRRPAVPQRHGGGRERAPPPDRSTACARDEVDEAERLLGGDGRRVRRCSSPIDYPRRRSPAGCVAPPMHCARCSSARAATSPPRSSPPGSRRRSTGGDRGRLTSRIARGPTALVA